MALSDTLITIGTSLAGGVALTAYVGPKVKDWRQARRDESDLIDGRPEAPGIPALLPMGTRLVRVEKKQDAMTLNLAALTSNVGDLDDKVDQVLAQFKPNGGNSMRDKVNELVNAKDEIAKDDKT